MPASQRAPPRDRSAEKSATRNRAEQEGKAARVDRDDGVLPAVSTDERGGLARDAKPIAASPPRLRSVRGLRRRSRLTTTWSGVHASNTSPKPISPRMPP